MSGRTCPPPEQLDDLEVRREDEPENNSGRDSAELEIIAPDPSIVELRNDEFPRYFSERGERLFHSGASPYPLPVDTPEQERQTALHDILRLFIGRNYVGPVQDLLAVEEGMNRHKMALDVCTGKGKWVLDMVDEFPHVRFIGLDIVPIMTRYPPENVQFEMIDVNETPLRWADGTFDLVHSRFVDMAVTDYERFAQEIARILRPGGLFVSYEWSPHPAFDQSSPLRSTAMHAPASTRFHNEINRALAERGLHELGSRVPEYLNGVLGAFTDVVARTHEVPIGERWPATGRLQRIGREYHATLYRYTNSIVPLLIEGGRRVDAVEPLIADYLAEINNVDGLVGTLYTVHARRTQEPGLY